MAPSNSSKSGVRGFANVKFRSIVFLPTKLVSQLKVSRMRGLSCKLCVGKKNTLVTCLLVDRKTVCVNNAST